MISREIVDSCTVKQKKDIQRSCLNEVHFVYLLFLLIE